MATVNLVVSVATHVPDVSVVRSHSAVSGVGKRVSDGNCTKVRQGRIVAVNERDGLDNPFSIDLAQRARGLLVVELVSQCVTCSLIGDVCDTSCG